MSVATDFETDVAAAVPQGRIGTLPDAPLAMPKQRLDPQPDHGPGLIAAWLRPFFAGTRRTGG